MSALSALIYATVTVGLVLLYVLGRRMQTVRQQRRLGMRLERIEQRHGP